MPTNNSSNSTNAQYNLIVGTGSAYTSIAPNATIGTPLCSAGASANPAYSTTPTVSSITISNSPSAATDGVNKAYADALIAGLDFKNSCYAATTATLNATYINGAAGIGATLVNAGSLVAFAVDGVSPPITSRILVKNQSSSFQNGIYTLTTVGSGAVAWILTRATDYDQASEIAPGDLVPVTNGTVNSSTTWLETATVATIGTDAITFVQFTASASAAITLSSGTNITVSGSPVSLGGTASIALSGQVAVANGGTGTSSFSNINSVLLSGTTTTNPLTSLLSGTSGYVLTSQGAGVAPIWQANSAGTLSINIQTFTTNGTYTPTSGMVYCTVECVAGGGGGAGTDSTTQPPLGVGGGGAGGDYSRSFFSATTIGASKAIVIGLGGAGGVGFASGVAGGQTTFGGSLAAAAGGAPGQYSTTFGSAYAQANGGAPSATGTSIGTLIVKGGYGGSGYANMTSLIGIPGVGGGTVLGTASQFFVNGNAGGNGVSGALYGGGGGGSYAWTGVASSTGGAGANGIVIVTEYIFT